MAWRGEGIPMLIGPRRTKGLPREEIHASRNKRTRTKGITHEDIHQFRKDTNLHALAWR